MTAIQIDLKTLLQKMKSVNDELQEAYVDLDFLRVAELTVTFSVAYEQWKAKSIAWMAKRTKYLLDDGPLE